MKNNYSMPLKCLSKKCWKENQYLVVALQYEKLKKMATAHHLSALSEESN